MDSVSQLIDNAAWPARVVRVAASLVAVAAVVVIVGTDTLAARLQSLAVGFDSDGTLSTENQQLIAKMIGRGGLVMAGAAAAAFVWAWLWDVAGRLRPTAAQTSTVAANQFRVADGAVLLLASLLLLGLTIAVIDRGLGYDEIVTVTNFVRADSWRDLLSDHIVFNNHIGYSAAARLSQAVFGTDDWVYRVPALMLGLLSLPLSWALGYALFGATTARIAVVLLAVSPILVEYSASARGYSGLLLCSVASALCLVSLLQSGKFRFAVLYSLAIGVGLWFHLYALLVLAAHATFLAAVVVFRGIATFDRRAVRLALLAVVAGAAVGVVLMSPSLPKFWLELNRRRTGEFLPSFPWTLGLELSGGLVLVLTLAVVGTLRQLWTNRWAVFILASLIVPVALPWFMKPFDLYARFFTMLLPLWVMVTVEGIRFVAAHSRLPSSTTVGVAMPWVAALVVAAAWGAAAPSKVLRDGFREAGEQMVEGAGPSAIFIGLGGAGALVSFYTDRPVHRPETVDEFNALVVDAPEVRVAVYRNSTGSAVNPILELVPANAVRTTHYNTEVIVWTLPGASDTDNRRLRSR